MDVQTAVNRSLDYSGTQQWNDWVGRELCQSAQSVMSYAKNTLNTILSNLDCNQLDLERDLKWVDDRLEELKKG